MEYRTRIGIDRIWLIRSSMMKVSTNLGSDYERVIIRKRIFANI